MTKAKILLVFAHPDDEVIFGWPMLQDKNFDKEIIICASDKYNPGRKWCAHRKDSLLALCADLQIPCFCFDHNSDFYRYQASISKRRRPLRQRLLNPFPKKGPLLFDCLQSIQEEVATRQFDYIFTHNPWGEYGHLDHIVVHTAIMRLAAHKQYRVLTSNACLQLTWMPMYPEQKAEIPADKLFMRETTLNESFYEHCKAFYTRDRVWTWNQEPVRTTAVYEL